tara:strand:+ start:255 stop:647 length:393 start_codon:yes stop_codon:yes gene_type:complete
MEKLELFKGSLLIRLFVLAIVFMSLFFVFDTWEGSFDQYKTLKNQLNNRIHYVNELKAEMGVLSKQIEEFDDPEKIDVILRKNGYGKPGEAIDIFEVPEPLTPLEETLKKDTSKGFIQYFIEFIVGKNGQ